MSENLPTFACSVSGWIMVSGGLRSVSADTGIGQEEEELRTDASL